MRCIARDGKHLRCRQHADRFDRQEAHQRIVRFTGYGFLVAKVRWFKTPPGGFNIGGQQTSIEFRWCRAPTPALAGLNDIAEFSLAYESMKTSSPRPHTRKDLGPDWPIYYEVLAVDLYAGRGQGSLAGRPEAVSFTEGRTAAAGPKRDVETDTDNQVNEITFGSFQEPGGHTTTSGYGWAATPDGSWNGFGVRRASAY